MSRAVIDQPGFRLFTLGFLLSLILGLAGRAQISSVRLEKSLQKSIRLLEKDFSVDFELAEVRLAKWGLPLPHLIVYKLRISPKKNFCHNSQIFIDELEVPLSFKSIFFPEEAIGFVRAKNVDIRLVDLDECLTPDSNQRKADAALPSSVVTSPGTSGNLFTNSTRSHLKEISIEQLKIISLKNFDQPLVFKQMRFFLDYKESRLSQVEIKSKIYSIKDSRADIFFLIADFNATLKPDPTQNIDLAIQLKGRLLDGDIQAFMQASSLSRKLSFEMTTHKVSIKAFAPFFNRFKNDFNLDKWPLNIGFYMVGDAEEQGLEKKAFFKIKNFEAMGENMSLRSPEIDIEFLNSRTDLKPFTMSLYRIPLTPLKSIFADHFNFQSIESLGFLKGDFKFDDAKYWNFEGLLEKPELIFSNRGSRELQTVDSVQVNLNHKNELFNFKLDNVRLNQSEMLGEIEGFYANENKSLQIKLNLEGPILNERVWKQLTQVSQSPVLKMNWTYKKVQDERH